MDAATFLFISMSSVCQVLSTSSVDCVNACNRS